MRPIVPNLHKPNPADATWAVVALLLLVGVFVASLAVARPWEARPSCNTHPHNARCVDGSGD
jgi:hypothetical protein